jgi:hypothetical protein
MDIRICRDAARHHVESLARGIINDISACRYDGRYIQHLAPHFLSINVDMDETTSRDDFVDGIRKSNDATHRRANDLEPFLRMQIVNSTSEMDRELRRATVWLTLSLGGLALATFKGIEREGIIRMRWMRVKGARWICIRACAMRGPGLMFA